MKSGQFSAYINCSSGHIALAKYPDDIEYASNDHYTPLIEGKAKRDVLSSIEEYFEENFIPEEQRVII